MMQIKKIKKIIKDLEDLDLHKCLFGARVNQHPPAHKEGWMIRRMDDKWSRNNFMLGSIP
jgi:hypothetical protein